MCFGNDFTVSSHFAIWGCSLGWVKANFHWNRHGSGTAANRSPKIMETIKVNVGYSTGYGTGTARNRPQTGTSFTILVSSISESCRFAAVSQNTTTANQFAFAHEYS